MKPIADKRLIFNIRVAPKSSQLKVIPIKQDVLKAYLTKPAYDGLANEQLIELLAKHFEIKKYQIRIVKGQKSRDKIVEITRAG